MQENEEVWVQSLGWKDPLEEEMAMHSSILAWIFHGQRVAVAEPVRLQSMGSKRVGND